MLFRTRKDTSNALKELRDSLPLEAGDLLMIHAISMTDPMWVEIEYSIFAPLRAQEINERLINL